LQDTGFPTTAFVIGLKSFDFELPVESLPASRKKKKIIDLACQLRPFIEKTHCFLY